MVTLSGVDSPILNACFELRGCLSHFRSFLLLLLLFRHSAKSLNAQDKHLVTLEKLVTRLHLPHAIVERLHVRKSNVVVPTLETAVTVGV